MPELPEVERATGVVRDVAVGKRIERVETVEDEIVFSGITHQEFATEIANRTVTGVGRHGKCFFLELDGHGRMPVLHFGMTGMLQVKGQLATYYKETPKSANTDWPPRFHKFILHLVDDATGEVAQLAFMDARRLGRVRLRRSPRTEPPISELGFDPILSMPLLEEFTPLVLKRSCPIKALLLDQSFSAGVGNWVADEILYNARIHPEQKCNTLSEEQLSALHHHTSDVCRIAVSVNADDSKFPEHWLFKHRWGKGKKEKHTLKLPSGEPATIKWITVGGRTSAYVSELQRAPKQSVRGEKKKRASRKTQKIEVVGDTESDLTALSDSEPDTVKNVRKRKASAKTSETPTSRKRRSRPSSSLTNPAASVT
ncbi:Formamidopyrimidine-DNA glycosylase [Hypsizygus marmoreus]|uniref:Formamidopyrimidine-DNA glycosylase n=1 Tax=Hypsizygus marmoreus TaxID=39966 RepID=A0A369K583_HYPMA|nr:Formamidopyrimidine-DNA glycosylase [Hypsizygus marmoreus]